MEISSPVMKTINPHVEFALCRTTSFLRARVSRLCSDFSLGNTPSQLKAWGDCGEDGKGLGRGNNRAARGVVVLLDVLRRLLKSSGECE